MDCKIDTAMTDATKPVEILEYEIDASLLLGKPNTDGRTKERYDGYRERGKKQCSCMKPYSDLATLNPALATSLYIIYK